MNLKLKIGLGIVVVVLIFGATYFYQGGLSGDITKSTTSGTSRTLPECQPISLTFLQPNQAVRPLLGTQQIVGRFRINTPVSCQLHVNDFDFNVSSSTNSPASGRAYFLSLKVYPVNHDLDPAYAYEVDLSTGGQSCTDDGLDHRVLPVPLSPGASDVDAGRLIPASSSQIYVVRADTFSPDFGAGQRSNAAHVELTKVNRFSPQFPNPPSSTRSVRPLSMNPVFYRTGSGSAPAECASL